MHLPRQTDRRRRRRSAGTCLSHGLPDREHRLTPPGAWLDSAQPTFADSTSYARMVWAKKMAVGIGDDNLDGARSEVHAQDRRSRHQRELRPARPTCG
jgi:hypothetical protein